MSTKHQQETPTILILKTPISLTMRYRFITFMFDSNQQELNSTPTNSLLVHNIRLWQSVYLCCCCSTTGQNNSQSHFSLLCVNGCWA